MESWRIEPFADSVWESIILSSTAVYADNSSTTPVDPEVIKSLVSSSLATGNASSTASQFGDASRKLLESGRSSISRLIGCDPRNLILTGSATESNNLAILGCGGAKATGHVICTAADHSSILEPTKILAGRNLNVSIIPVGNNGGVSADQVEQAIRPDTVLVSIVLVNNEVGTINPLSEIGEVCRKKGVLLHTDATQAVGKIPIDVSKIPIDLMSFSAHKMYGPKGVGALYVNRQTVGQSIRPIMYGGDQEQGLRPGTVAVPLAVAFGTAAKLCQDAMSEESQRIESMRDRLWERIRDEIPDVVLNTPLYDRIYNNLNVSFIGVPSEAFMIKMRDIVVVSAGSACMSSKSEPSHVLRAMGIHGDRLESAIRFGFGRFNTMDEIEHIASAIQVGIKEIRG